MISVLITSESHYKINRKSIRRAIEAILQKAGLTGAQVSISIVGSRKIKKLNRDYRHLDEVTDVLSFPLESSRGPDGILMMGDIVVCFPEAVNQAIKENRMVDEKINELIAHGLNHLMGIHHEGD
jgi:rRNA maturation RNase YbeY